MKRPGLSSGPSRHEINCGKESDQTGFLQGGVGAVLVDGLDRLAAQGEAQPAVQLGHPDALGLEVRSDLALHDLGHVATDTALFLGETGTIDTTARANSASSDAADTGHGMKKGKGLLTRGAENGRGQESVKAKFGGNSGGGILTTARELAFESGLPLFEEGEVAGDEPGVAVAGFEAVRRGRAVLTPPAGVFAGPLVRAPEIPGSSTSGCEVPQHHDDAGPND